jgi:toxin YoeB
MHALKFDSDAWEDYLHWLSTDKGMLKRINGLIKEIVRGPYVGIGKPEPLKHELSGWWSRRVTNQHRLVYRVVGNTAEIAKISYHY